MKTGQEIDKNILTENILDGIFISSKSGEILYSNQAFATITGHPKSKIVTMNICKGIVDRELEWRALVSLLEQGSPIQDYEIKFRKADGTISIISLTASMLHDDNGVQIGIAGVARDISTRKGIEHDLRDKAFRSDILNRIAKLAGTSNDVKAVLGSIADEFRKLTDFDRVALGVMEDKDRHVEVLIPDPSNPRKAKSLGKVPYEGSLVEKLKFGGNAIIVEKDVGRKLFSEFSIIETTKISSMMAVPLISRGKILGSLSMMHSRQGEYNWDSAEALQMVADLLGGMIDSTILFSSTEKQMRLQETLIRSGVELQKAIGTAQIYAAIASFIKEIVPYKDLSFYIIDWQRRTVFPVYVVGGYEEEILASSGGLDEGMVGQVAKSGKAEFVDDVDSDPRTAAIPGMPLEHDAMMAIPLIGSDGVIGVLELYRDRGTVFTQSDLEAGLLFAQQASVALSNAQLVAKLQEANKEIELLNDLMFHDINNYNFATMNYIETAAKSPDLPKELHIYLDKSLQLIRKNAKLIDNVKKLTKIGIMNPNDFVPVNLSDVIRKIVSSISSSSPNKTISIKLNIPERAFIKANALVEELIFNLLSNAVKYDNHDEIEIDIDMTRILDDDAPCWKICISDNGPGIPDEKKDMLFQRFVRLKTDSKVAGTGLGLSICRALTDKFMGRIWVEDKVKGKSELGTRFCLLFPAERHQPE